MKFVEELEPVMEGEERAAFVAEVEKDSIIQVWKELGRKNLQGFRFNKGLLVQSRLIEWGSFGEVIVVPSAYTEKLMTLGHEKMGHLGGEKVWHMIKRRFM